MASVTTTRDHIVGGCRLVAGSERDAAALVVKICQWHIFSQSGRKCPGAFWYFSAHDKYVRFLLLFVATKSLRRNGDNAFDRIVFVGTYKLGFH